MLSWKSFREIHTLSRKKKIQLHIHFGGSVTYYRVHTPVQLLLCGKGRQNCVHSTLNICSKHWIPCSKVWESKCCHNWKWNWNLSDQISSFCPFCLHIRKLLPQMLPQPQNIFFPRTHILSKKKIWHPIHTQWRSTHYLILQPLKLHSRAMM